LTISRRAAAAGLALVATTCLVAAPRPVHAAAVPGTSCTAIRFTVHQTDNTYLWPARHEAGIADASLPPMGARFRLKATYSDPTLGTEAQVVLTAFKHYGLIVADNGSDWYFQGTEDSSWDDPLISDLKKIPVDQFEAVDESSLMADPNSAETRSRLTAPAPAGSPASRLPVGQSTPASSPAPRVPTRPPAPLSSGEWAASAPRAYFLRL
jgi:hypothetical protein